MIIIVYDHNYDHPRSRQRRRKNARHPRPRPRHVANSSQWRPSSFLQGPSCAVSILENKDKRDQADTSRVTLTRFPPSYSLENETRSTKRSPPSRSEAERSRYRDTAITRSEAQRCRYIAIIAYPTLPRPAVNKRKARRKGAWNTDHFPIYVYYT